MLILVSVLMLVLAGVAGLALDAGTLYVAWNHERTLTEAGALSAAMVLDGSAGAGNAALQTAGSERIRMEFAASPIGPWGGETAGAAAVRVTRTVEVPLHFMRAFSDRSSTTVRVTVVAERSPGSPVRARLVER